MEQEAIKGGQGVKIAGVVAMRDFPLWEQCITALCEVVDELYVRFDGVSGDPEILRRLPEVAGDKLKHVHIAKDGWHPPQWREDCIQLLDGARPDVVLCPDEDEIFGDGVLDEIKQFANSDKQAMMFGYEPLVTVDGREVNGGVTYPPLPHMKGFKWAEGLSYYPWHKNAVVARYVNPECHWKARTKIRHLCCYTAGLEAGKQWRSDIPGRRANKAVTLLGFGPSAHGPDAKIKGEVWSLNNCYEVFAKETMRFCTRIFEMHPLGVREVGGVRKERGMDVMKNGQTHVWNLNECGKRGHRVVLQARDERIENSEAYPLQDVLAHFGGFRLFAGSGAYLVALAVLEGYTEINVYGFDQMDWEHIIQRESMQWWLGVAMGAGITVGGRLTVLDRYPRLYGYEYGPEFDAECQKALWLGFPFEIRIKEPSRAMAGEMCGGVGG